MAERRVAVVVGANGGWSSDRPLRHAEDDARRMRDVLVDMGGFAADDVILLTEPQASAVSDALSALATRISTAREPTLLFYYYSGHADAEALHLRGPLLKHRALVSQLSAIGATLTVAVIDACMSGAILGAKGASSVVPFRVRAEEPVQGLALLSSSDADELSQESRALAGSVFTHHWVSALRGAADLDGDGAISLMEAYGYAYERTRADTLSTALPQRPGYRFDLRGQGDIVLTRLTREQAATVELPPGPAQRYVVVDATERALIAEAASTPDSKQRIQLAPGAYKLKRPVAEGVEVADLVLAKGSIQDVTALSYRLMPKSDGYVKGPTGLAMWAASGSLGQGDAQTAIELFSKALQENPFEVSARQGKARALLVRSLELQHESDRPGELGAIKEALRIDPGLLIDPSFNRFHDRSRVLTAELEREATIRKAVELELKRNPRVKRTWGIGLQLVSTKGVFVLEGHWTPKPWLDVSLSVDLLGPGIDASARWLPLSWSWTPYIGGGLHYGTGLWRKTSKVTIQSGDPGSNAPSSSFSYDEYWGTVFHADVGFQWMSEGGFVLEVGGGPMAFYSASRGAFVLGGMANLGLGWYF